MNEIQKKIGSILFPFVNGSFTTLKNKPDDIDVVTFLDYRLYRQELQNRVELTEKWDAVSEIDGYIVPRSYPGHPLFIQAQLTYEYWKDLFSSSRKIKSGNRINKGFIKVNFHE